MNKERVDARVEPELLEELDEIAQRLGLGSRSSAIREAIASYVTEQRDGWNTTGLNVRLPKRMTERLQRHIMNGDARDADEAIVLALDFWLRDLEVYYLRRRARLESAVRENIASDSALEQMSKDGRDLEGL